MPAVERIANKFLPLKLYFEANENCPKLLTDFFKDPMNEIYFLSVQANLPMFQKTIFKIEGDHINASEVYQAYFELISNLEEKKNHRFITFAARQLLRKFNEDATIDEAMFNKSEHPVNPNRLTNYSLPFFNLTRTEPGFSNHSRT